MLPQIIAQDLPSRNFAPLLYGVGAWTGHLHFGYDLVALLRPRVFVELGVDRGESYFTFCQAAAEGGLGLRVFGIDTWQGDAHAGGYDETTFAEVTLHNREHYNSFSTLLRMPFDEALSRFSAEQIDILHIDGLHTESAVRHDVESWLPKLRPGGILLLHDVSVRTRDFGVWKIWEELRERGRAWTFEVGPGLGVWQKPPAKELPAPLESLLTGPNEWSDRLLAYYRGAAARLADRIAEQWRDGSVSETAAARQTAIQVFFTRDGTHREEDSVFARVGHDGPKNVTLQIPAGGCGGALRVDFVSAFTSIEISSIELTDMRGKSCDPAGALRGLADLRLGGDAEREPHPTSFRFRVTGIDPQIYLPLIPVPESAGPVLLKLNLRVLPAERSAQN